MESGPNVTGHHLRFNWTQGFYEPNLILKETEDVL
jgi:hypothetical protein